MPMIFDGRRHPNRTDVAGVQLDLDALGHDDLVKLARERGLPAFAAGWKTETLKAKLLQSIA